MKNNQRKAAIASGTAIVIMAVAAVIANDLSINRLIVTGNAAETVRNIMNSALLYRTGVFAWLIILVCDALAAWGLYNFFKPVNKNLSLLMGWFRIVYVAMLGAAMLNLVYVLPMTEDAGYLSAYGSQQLEAQVMFYLNAFHGAWSLSLVVFGVHILLLGYLLIKSGFRVKILGIIMVIAFAGYTLVNIAKLLSPQYERLIELMEWIFLAPMLGEIAVGIWLLLKGILTKTPAQTIHTNANHATE